MYKRSCYKKGEIRIIKAGKGPNNYMIINIYHRGMSFSWDLCVIPE